MTYLTDKSANIRKTANLRRKLFPDLKSATNFASNKPKLFLRVSSPLKAFDIDKSGLQPLDPHALTNRITPKEKHANNFRLSANRRDTRVVSREWFQNSLQTRVL